MILHLLLLGLFFLQTVRAASPALVIIDAGHGGKDSGGTGNGLVEKDLTLDTARRLQAKLNDAGIRNVMLRTSDTFIDLDERVAMANRYEGKNAVLVSIHFNAVGGNAPHGLETFFWRPDATALATRIQKHVAAQAGLANIAINRRRLRLTRNPTIPSVLVEAGYMTNSAEARRLSSAKTRDAIAQGICDGIEELRREGEEGIRRVPEIASPLSRPTDPPDGGQRIKI